MFTIVFLLESDVWICPNDYELLVSQSYGIKMSRAEEGILGERSFFISRVTIFDSFNEQMKKKFAAQWVMALPCQWLRTPTYASRLSLS